MSRTMSDAVGRYSGLRNRLMSPELIHRRWILEAMSPAFAKIIAVSIIKIPLEPTG